MIHVVFGKRCEEKVFFCIHLDNPSRLNARIILLNAVSSRIFIPGSTVLLERRSINHRLELGHALHELHRETLGLVPANMAMQQPRSRVVSLERDDQIAESGEHGRVTTGWVVGVQSCVRRVASIALGEDEEVVALSENYVSNGCKMGSIRARITYMKMNRMRNIDGHFNIDNHPLAVAFDLNNV